MELQHDIITLSIELSGNSTSTILSGQDFTIVGIGSAQEKDLSDTIVLINGLPIYKNFAQSVGYIPMNATGTNLEIIKTGNDEAFLSINYLPYIRQNDIKQGNIPDYVLTIAFLSFAIVWTATAFFRYFLSKKK